MSNNNANAESIFSTCKYRPNYPYKGFVTLANAREWVLEFVHWYNVRHHRSGIKFMTPEQRHKGDDKEVTVKRTAIYEAAKNKHPERWSGQTRNWELPKEVHLNPASNSLEIKQILEVITTTSLTTTAIPAR